MLRLVFVCALIVSQVPACGDEQKLMATTRVIRLATTNALGSRCGAHNRHAYACTQFVGQQLSASCSAENGLWSMRPKAEYVALVYLVDLNFFHHENLHHRDMEKAVTTHIATLETERFDTRTSCEAAANAAVVKFTAAMREFASKSNSQRH